MTALYRFSAGDGPVVVNVPHAGAYLPDDIAAGMSDAGRAVADTDWHVDRLYDFAPELGVSLLTATHSRYVVDLNRDPDGQPLYPGADNTEVCPTATFDNAAIYPAAGTPDAAEIARRIDAYWRPYHAKLASVLDDMQSRHRRVVLIDGHSIRSRVPRFFDGRLPDLNFGTARAASADHQLAARVYDVLADADGFSSVRDGRFTGGYITRRYGRPASGLHAVQLEMAQTIYMEERPPFRYQPDKAGRLKPVLRRMVETALAWAWADE